RVPRRGPRGAAPRGPGPRRERHLPRHPDRRRATRGRGVGPRAGARAAPAADRAPHPAPEHQRDRRSPAMTTATAAPRPLTNRMLGVVRLQLINTQSLVWVPLIVLAGAVAISLMIIPLIPFESTRIVGSAQAP